MIDELTERRLDEALDKRIKVTREKIEHARLMSHYLPGGPGKLSRLNKDRAAACLDELWFLSRIMHHSVMDFSKQVGAEVSGALGLTNGLPALTEILAYLGDIRCRETLAKAYDVGPTKEENVKAINPEAAEMLKKVFAGNQASKEPGPASITGFKTQGFQPTCFGCQQPLDGHKCRNSKCPGYVAN